eukprot:gene8912-6398_t
MIRVGVIGAGIFVKETYLPLVAAHRDKVTLTAILSRSAGPIESCLEVLSEGSADVRRFVGAEGEEAFFAQATALCDAVIVVVPIPLLAQYVEKCLQVGLAVLSEKPVAANSSTARELIGSYREWRRERPSMGLWHVAENYRLESSIVYARTLVRDHARPPKTFALTCIRQQTPTAKYAVTEWRAQPTYHGSFVLDGGIHFVALMRHVLNGATISDVQCQYEETSVVEVGTCGSCRVDGTLGTVQIRYGAFPTPVCRFDVFFEDAILSITQVKGVGYEVAMTGHETRQFGFDGLEREFVAWIESVAAQTAIPALQPEEGLVDLVAVEDMCATNRR